MSDASKDPLEADELLDQLLRQSARSDVDADRIDRLARQWQSISRRRVRVQAGLMMFVCLTVSVGSWLAFRGNRFGTQIVKPEVLPEQPAEVIQRVVRRESSSPNSNGGDPAVGAMAVYDQLVCVAVQRRARERRRDRQSTIQEPQVPIDEPKAKQETIDDIVSLTVHRIAQQQAYDDLIVRFKDQWSEPQLLAWMEAAEDTEAIDAALQLLEHCVTNRAIAVLMRFRSTHYERCTRLIAQVADPQLLFRLAQEESDKTLGQELAAALLRHSNPQAVYLFLQLVDNRPTSAMALAGAAKVEAMPTDLLMQCLASRSRKLRLTAAMALAQSNDPQVSTQLIQLLQGSRTRRAAMVALVASDDDFARRFVDQASRDVYLAASVHAAQTVVNSFRLQS